MCCCFIMKGSFMMKKYSFRQFILKQQEKIKKSSITFALTLTATVLFPVSVFAEGNAITQSTPFKGIMKLLTDLDVALLIIAPIACGVLIGVFSLKQGFETEQHDKEKWDKNKKNVLTVLWWILGASGLVTLVAGYFK